MDITPVEQAVAEVVLFDNASGDVMSTRLDRNGNGTVTTGEIDQLISKLESINNVQSASTIYENLGKLVDDKNNYNGSVQLANIDIVDIHQDITDVIKNLRLTRQLLDEDEGTVPMDELYKTAKRTGIDPYTKDKNGRFYAHYIIHKYLDSQYPELVVSKPKVSHFNRDYYGNDNQFAYYDIKDGTRDMRKHIDINGGRDILRIDFGKNVSNNDFFVKKSLFPNLVRDEDLSVPNDTLLIKIPGDYSGKSDKHNKNQISKYFNVTADVSKYSGMGGTIIKYNTKDSLNNTITIPSNFGDVSVFGDGMKEPVNLFGTLKYTPPEPSKNITDSRDYLLDVFIVTNKVKKFFYEFFTKW